MCISRDAPSQPSPLPPTPTPIPPRSSAAAEVESLASRNVTPHRLPPLPPPLPSPLPPLPRTWRSTRLTPCKYTAAPKQGRPTAPPQSPLGSNLPSPRAAHRSHASPRRMCTATSLEHPASRPISAAAVDRALSRVLLPHGSKEDVTHSTSTLAHHNPASVRPPRRSAAAALPASAKPTCPRTRPKRARPSLECEISQASRPFCPPLRSKHTSACSPDSPAQPPGSHAQCCRSGGTWRVAWCG